MQVVEVEDGGRSVLRCLLTDGERYSRFRVDFSGGTAISSSPSPPSSPQQRRLSQLSPNLNQTRLGPGNSPIQAWGTYACAIVLVQERGSLTVFRALSQRLREVWRFDGDVDGSTDGGEPVLVLGGAQNMMPLMEGVEQCVA